jgi:hypothetical protein
MSKSVLTIHKEIERKEYAASSLGKLEKVIGEIYREMQLKKEALPENIAKEVYDIREENEKWQMQYIDDRLKADREAVDSKLLESMTRELAILEKNGYTRNR